MNWLIENSGTIIVSIILILAIYLALRSIKKAKDHGGSSCGCNCSGCSSTCHSSNSIVDSYHQDYSKQ